MPPTDSKSPAPRATIAGSILRTVRLLVLVPLARLRFLFILGAIGLILVKWDELVAWYEKLVHPSATATASADPDHEFFCPMHPAIVRADNREKCPICFMPLSRRKKGDATDDPLPAGVVSRVQLTPYRVVLAGVRTNVVDYEPLARELTTVGTVEFDETRMRTVAARVKARIEKLLINQTGQAVREGEPLAELYSPDLVVTVQNLRDAKASGDTSMQAIARDRLHLWGIDDREIDDLSRGQGTATRLVLRSPIGGYVIRKYLQEGQYVEEGTRLFEVADLSTVWVQAQVYEDDIAFLPAAVTKHGDPGGTERLPVTTTTRAFPGRVFEGTLSFLYPHVDTETRTLTARFELPNPKHELRPGMTATVTLKLTPEMLTDTPAGERLQTAKGSVLAIPESSLIDTGRQKVAFRESLPNTYEGVAVEIGPQMHTPAGAVYYPVLSGLRRGDLVVTAGSFLIDAETRLNPAMGSIYVGGSGGNSDTGAAPVRPSAPSDPDATIAAALGKLSPEDRKLAEGQKWCPVLQTRLGSMGTPIRLRLGGRTVFVCCEGCVKKAESDPQGMLDRIDGFKRKHPTGSPGTPSLPSDLTPGELADIRQSLNKLPAQDRRQAESQLLCPISNQPLGSMGVPVKRNVRGRTVFICCEGCDFEIENHPEKILEKLGQPPAKQPVEMGEPQ